MAIVKDAIKDMESMMSPESVERAQLRAKKIIFQMRLAELRKKMGVNQDALSNFTQTAVSRLERRSDMKLSNLMAYLDDIGLAMEIRVRPKVKRKGIPKEITLLKG